MKAMAAALAAASLVASLARSTPATAAPAVEPRGDLGHVLIITSEFQLYVRTTDKSVIFSAVLPKEWSYTVNFDLDNDETWGAGPFSKSKPQPGVTRDFAYAQTNEGALCAQYIDASYAENRDLVYLTTDCGTRKSAATLHIGAASETQALKVYTIPKAELRASHGAVRFAIEVWDGQASRIFGSPRSPFTLTI